MMTPDAIDGFWISLVIITAWIVMCPILCWVLPDRSNHVLDETGRV